MLDWVKVNEQTKLWIMEAGERIRTSLKSTLEITTKSNKNDLVTNVDRETEQFFIEKIRTTYNDHRILGEEGGGDKLSDVNGIVWVIDPIDGTMNFVHMQRNFTISIGIFENGIGRLGYIYDVIHDELYSAFKGHGAYFNNKQIKYLEEVPVERAIVGMNPIWLTENHRINPKILRPLIRDVRGTRSYGSAALEMGYVANGWLDAYIAMYLAPWDFAAGWIIIEELGGKATKLNGEPLSLLEKSSLFVAKPGLHEAILKNYLQEYEEKK
ncbi:inositol monophosphatase family protein [Bacillus andreraoultii]|uniref:inositol monophosphatase family protein n=1 Tax=Bacillus andreraoultii TaxID=1499685 RepID=UPI00053B30F6|nr:inositol monophosphatase [Bacillus andreraoultii]